MIKQHKNIKFIEQIKLFETNEKQDLEKINLKHFDKNFMQYKKNFMVLTKNELIFIGYTPKSKELSKTYQKEYSLNNISNIILNYENRQFSYTTTQIKEIKRTTTDNYGNNYVETIRDEVPVEKIGNKNVFIYGAVYFKNLLVELVCFDFKNQNKSMHLAERFCYKCKNLKIDCCFSKEEN